jgi:hypothetical protein
MGFLDPSSASRPAVVRAVVRDLLEELREQAEQIDGFGDLPAPVESRRWTVRALLADLLALADARPVESLEPTELHRLANLLYDTELVAAEYTKLFFRDPHLAPPTPPVRGRAATAKRMDSPSRERPTPLDG